jgi:hypothetical protein
MKKWAAPLDKASGLGSIQTTVTVEKYTQGKHWSGTADVTYSLNGQTIKAHMHTFGHSVRRGEEVEALYLPDSKVLAFEQDRWWRAEVVELQPGDMVRIHFPGWDPRWDRSVAKNELQLDTERARSPAP